MILASLISRLDVGFVFFKWVALVFCPRRPRGLVRASSGALVWKPVICGCCRVTSQKKLSYRLQALSSLFFEVMPSIHRIRLDGWFSRCRGQSSGKSASRQRASQERRSTRKVTSAVQEMFKRVKPCSRDVQESQAMFKRCSRERALWLARCFQQSNLALPTGGLSNPIVRMGRSSAHVQAFWGWCPSDPIFHSFRGRYKLTDYIYV